MVSDGAVLALSGAAADSVRLSVRLAGAMRSLCMSPFPVVVVAMAGGSHRFAFVETRLAASCGENGEEGGTCVLGLNHRKESGRRSNPRAGYCRASLGPDRREERPSRSKPRSTINGGERGRPPS